MKPKMYSFLVDQNSKHWQAKSVNKNVVTTISSDEYKDFLLLKKYLKHSMKRIQCKDHITGIFEIDQFYLMIKYIS